MAIITKNEYGTVAINNKMLSKLVVDELLTMQSIVYMCNKKGKAIKKKPTPFIDPDFYDSVEVKEKASNGLEVTVYLVLRFSTNISKITNRLFDKIENAFEIFNIKQPTTIVISYKGIDATYKSKKNLKVKRTFNC